MPSDDASELKGAFGEFRSAVLDRLDRLETKVETKLDSVVTSLDAIHERLTDHEGRIGRLEQHAKERVAWWRAALTPLTYLLFFVAGALGIHVARP